MRKTHIIISVIFILKLSGCIQTPEPDVPKRVSFLFNTQTVGESIVVGQDSIIVNEFKLVADKLNIELPDESILQTSVGALVFSYRREFMGEDENVLTANIGFEDFDRFRGLVLFVDHPEEGDNIQDNDFFGDEMNFSFVMKGTYNTQDFIYRSGVSFSKSFAFGNIIELSNKNETLIVRIVSDIKNVLLNESGNKILNPNNSNDTVLIDSLFQQSIVVVAFAGDFL